MLAGRFLPTNRALLGHWLVSLITHHQTLPCALLTPIQVEPLHESIDLLVLLLQDLEPPLFLQDELSLLLEPMLDAEAVSFCLQLIHVLVDSHSLFELKSELLVDGGLLLFPT